MGADFRMASQQSPAISFVALSFPAHRSRVRSFVPDGGRAPAAFHTYSAPRMASGANEDGTEPRGFRLVAAADYKVTKRGTAPTVHGDILP